MTAGTDHFALSYDGLNRLSSITGPVSESFTFDGASNVTTRTGPNQTDSYDGANRITSDGTLTYTWSDADRLSTRGADTFTHDALDRLRSSSVGGMTRTYMYNGDGLLQSRAQGTTTPLLWDPSTEVSPLLELGADVIVYGHGPLYAVRPDASTVTFARDGSKNVRAEVSNSGLLTGAWRYRVYGEVAAGLSIEPPAYFGLAGQLRDSSGFYFMRARWYDPVVGRFVSRDPLTGRAADPVSLNSYAYAAADPVGLVDPSGLEPNESDLGEPLCTPLIPLPGKCFAPGRFAEDYEAWILSAVRPIGGLGLQVALTKMARADAGSGGGGGGGGGSGTDKVDEILRGKPVNLPAWRSIAIDMEHVSAGHMGGGASVSKDQFPAHMTRQQVESVIRYAYRYAVRIRTQGERVLVRGPGNGFRVEMWVNTKTRMIETAYPRY